MAPESQPAVHIQELATLEQLHALVEEWQELWRLCPTATVFQSPAWLIPWWQFVGTGRLCMLAFRQEDQLVGIAPLFILPSTGSAGQKVLLLGTGNSDYLDILARPEADTAVSARLFAYLEERADDWDGADFQELRPESILLSNAKQHESIQFECSPQSVCPGLTLPKASAELPATIPHHTLEKLRYYRRRLEKAGDVRVEVATAENFRELFDAFLQLHSKRWSIRQSPGALAGNALESFHREAANGLLKMDALRLFALRLNDQIIATLYCFRSRDRMFYYLGGFDPGYATFSPGTLLIGHASESAIQEEAVEFDFLRGQESYKYAWGARDRHTYTLQLCLGAGVANR